MKRAEKKTIDKIKKLSNTLGKFNEKETKSKEPDKKNRNTYFKMSEVLMLLVLTSVVSLLMGGVITYKFFYKSGKNIDSHLQEFIKNYDYITNSYYKDVNKDKLIDSAIAGMLETLDKNSSYVGSVDSSFSIYLEGSYEGLGVKVYNDDNKNIVIYEVLENSPASRAGLQKGDIITKINKESLLNTSTQKLSEIVKKQKGSFDLTYKRDGKENKVKIKISKISINSVASKIINKDNKKIGYIELNIFANNTYEQFKTKLEELEKENIDSLIIDVRSNSGGHLTSAENIVSLFLDSTHPIYQIKSKDRQDKYYSKGKTTKKYKIVVLVDNSSASASELVASALKEQYNAVLVGKKTYGKGTVQELQSLTSGSQYKLTTKTWLTSKGNVVDKKGVAVDVDVDLDQKFIDNPTEENDNQLQKAIEEVLK